MSAHAAALDAAVDELAQFINDRKHDALTHHERFESAVGTIDRAIRAVIRCRDAGVLCEDFPEPKRDELLSQFAELIRSAFHILREVVCDHIPALLATIDGEINEIERETFAVFRAFDWDAQASRARWLIAEFDRRRWPLLRPLPARPKQDRPTRPRGRQRRTEDDPEVRDENKLYTDWEASGLSQLEFLRALGRDEKEGLKILDRARKRLPPKETVDEEAEGAGRK